MTTLMLRQMAKRTAKPDGDPPTRMIRVRTDLAEMMAWVCKAQGLTASELLDIVLRPAVQRRYAENYELILRLKKNEDASAVERGEEPGPALPSLTPEPGAETAGPPAEVTAEVTAASPKKRPKK